MLTKIFRSAFTERRARTLSIPYMGVATVATFGTITSEAKEKESGSRHCKFIIQD